MFAIETTCGEGTLHVEFTRVKDRFTHTITLSRDGAVLERIGSVEGTSADVWPPSPPVQEVYQQDNVLLMTGMSGTSYWSGSVAVVEPGVLEFDCACRYRETPAELGSCYTTSGTHLVIEPVNNSASHEVRAQTHLVAEPLPAPATTRWMYRVALR